MRDTELCRHLLGLLEAVDGGPCGGKTKRAGNSGSSGTSLTINQLTHSRPPQT